MEIFTHMNQIAKIPVRRMVSTGNRGALIVFEGCDRSGKSTQSALLLKHLESQKISVKHMNFPDRTTIIGKMCDEYIRKSKDMSDECVHLLFSANRWELKEEMQKLLSSGVTLIVDRYSYSGVAYTAAKGLDIKWCKAPEVGLVLPDIVVHLGVPVDTMQSREGFGNDRYEKVEFQKKVAEIYESFSETEREYWIKIDANRPIDDIQQEIQDHTHTVLNDIENKPLRPLWPN